MIKIKREPIPAGISWVPINIHGTPCRLEVSHYADNGRLAILVNTSDGAPYAKLTVNIPEAELEPGEFCVKTWGENEHLAPILMETGLFEDTEKKVPTGYVRASVWRASRR